MKRLLYLALACLLIAACRDDYAESEYTCGNYRVFRQDWNNCMTRLTYFDPDGNELGSTLDYYPGIGGWFLADLIFGDSCIYYSPCDACPQVVINDSAQLIVSWGSDSLPSDKACWRRISIDDDAPVVTEANAEYGSRVTHTFLKKGKDPMPPHPRHNR